MVEELVMGQDMAFETADGEEGLLRPVGRIQLQGECFLVCNVVEGGEEADTLVLRETQDGDGSPCYEEVWDKKLLEQIFTSFMKEEEQEENH